MNPRNKKGPNRAETGQSMDVHSATMNETNITMIFENPYCLALCCEFLDRFECLLQRFTPNSPEVYIGNEIDAFIALSNLERSIDGED